MSFSPNDPNAPSSPAAKPGLPCGGYIVTIQNATVAISPKGHRMLMLTTEIIEGSYVRWFQTDYEQRHKGFYPTKRRGIYRIFYPKGDGSELDGKNIERFNRAITTIEKSNDGFTWDWNDPTQLAGKVVGIVVREFEWDGHVYTDIGKLTTVNAVRHNTFKPMDRYVMKSHTKDNADNIPPGFTKVDPGETPLPF